MSRIFDPATFTMKETDDVPLKPIPGMLYRHDSHPSIWRCTSIEESRRGNRAMMDIVWCLIGFKPEKLMKTLGAIGKDPTHIQCNLGDNGEFYGWILVDAVWLGQAYRELTDLIQSEFCQPEK